jgi:WD40 repeat protein
MNKNLKSLFICKICNRYFDQPVNLGCFCVICKCHSTELPRIDNTNTVKCPICQDDFELPPHGEFKVNRKLKELIDNDEHLSDDREKTLKQAIKASLIALEHLANESEPKLSALDNQIEAHYEKCKSKIEDRRSELVREIDEFSSKLLEHLQTTKEKYAKQKEKLEIKRELDEAKELNSILIEGFSNPDLNLPEIEQLKNQQDTDINTIQTKVKWIESEMLNFEAIQFEGDFQLDIINFGSIKHQFSPEQPPKSQQVGATGLLVSESVSRNIDTDTSVDEEDEIINNKKRLKVDNSESSEMMTTQDEDYEPKGKVRKNLVTSLESTTETDEEKIQPKVKVEFVEVAAAAEDQNQIVTRASLSPSSRNHVRQEDEANQSDDSQDVIILDIHENADETLPAENEDEQADKSQLELISCSWDNSVKVWDIQTGVCIKTYTGFSKDLQCLEILNASKFVCGYENSNIIVWNLEKGECLRTVGHRHEVCCLKSIGGNLLASGSKKEIKLWNIDSGFCIKTLAAHTSWVNCLEVDLNRNWLISGSQDSKIKVWDYKDFTLVKTLSGHDDGIKCIKVLPNDLLATGSCDKSILLWNMVSGKCLQTFNGHNGWIWALEFRLEKNQLISCSYDRTIKFWCLTKFLCVKTIRGHKDSVNNVKLIDKNKLVTCSDDLTIKIWDLKTNRCLKTLEGHTKEIWGLDLHNGFLTNLECSNFE